MINFDETITTYLPKCSYCNIVYQKGYWHWTHALIYNEETKKALCKCKEMKV